MDKSSNKTVSMKSEGGDDDYTTASPSSLINVDNFSQEEILSKNFSSQELHQEFSNNIMLIQKVLASVKGTSIDEESQKYTEDNEVMLAQSNETWICEIISIVSQLKRINRLDKHRLKNSRDRVAKCKQKVDEKSLKYQNMLSELAYLKKKTESSLEFSEVCKSDLSTIDLIPIEEFCKEAPAEMTNEEITNDKHELTLARLKWELEKRKLLAKEVKETELKRKEIELEVRNLTDSLRSMKPMLEKLQEAAAAPLEAISIPPFQEYYSAFKDAKSLPLPLRKIFNYLRGHAEVYNNANFQVHVNVVPTEIPRAAAARAIAYDDGYDLYDIEEPQSFREENNSLPKVHDFSLQWILIDNGSALVLLFRFVESLNFISVEMQKLIPDPSLCLPVNKLLMADRFLDNLFPGDNGQDIPSPDIIPLFHNFGITHVNSVFPYPFGTPYIWAQKFSGIKFGSKSNPLSLRNMVRDMPSSISHAKYVSEIIEAIKSKMRTRISLTTQLNMFVSRCRLPNAVASILPNNIAARLKYFTDACMTDIFFYPNWSTLKEDKILTDDCFLYKLEIERGSANLYAIVIVPPNYPVKTPIFLLSLNWKGTFNNINSIEIRELEEEINIHFVEDIQEKHEDFILQCQVHYLRACLDVYLETHPSNDVIEGPREFASDLIIAEGFRGRSFSRPYKYVPALRSFMFR